MPCLRNRRLRRTETSAPHTLPAGIHARGMSGSGRRTRDATAAGYGRRPDFPDLADDRTSGSQWRDRSGLAPDSSAVAASMMSQHSCERRRRRRIQARCASTLENRRVGVSATGRSDIGHSLRTEKRSSATSAVTRRETGVESRDQTLVSRFKTGNAGSGSTASGRHHPSGPAAERLLAIGRLSVGDRRSSRHTV